jgi:subtilisin family serine protease
MTSTPRRSGSRNRRYLVPFAAAVPLIAAVLAAPAAQPATGLPATGLLPQPSLSEAATASTKHSVTLVTGDVVTVTTLADGQQIADVDRPDSAVGGIQMQEMGGDLYILPDEAMALIAAEKLDQRLFNVTDLIEMGYDDASSDELPLIATYTPSKARAADPVAPRGSELVTELESVDGAALETDKDRARAFWNSVAHADGSSFRGGVAELWLDGRVEASLKESVPQVGAPTAWAAGFDGSGVKVAVLDTGIDATHPDLVDQIDDKVSFVPGEDASDVHGHGTHVASTIAGTGAASNGDNKGVAPGADLLVGKVLGNDGFGSDSWVIEGMEWAAQSGADVVNMSLGDSVPSDGSDPMSMAVNDLTAQYGTLFVIASGNSGPESIAAPGAAASALTVGAVDKQDRLANFSGTGPLTVSGAIKPDIAAPGVAINAARSQQMTSGTGMYWSLNGTSMATPHVAGAAAIVAQRHPDWSGEQIKTALMSSSKGLAAHYTPYQVGTGRLDVAAAVDNTVQATGSAFFGNFTWPHDPTDAPVDRTVTFTNSGDVDVALDLAVTGTGPFRLSAPSVSVPAGGSADVTVTGDPTAAANGTRSTGYLIGTDAATGTAVTRTSLAMLKEAERYDLTVKLTDREGSPASSRVVVNRAGSFFSDVYEVHGQRTLRLPPGTYTVGTSFEVAGEKDDSLGFAVLVNPVTVLDESTEVVLDASEARLLDTVAPARTEDRQRKIDYLVTYASGRTFRNAYQIPVKYDDLYVSPTDVPTEGSFQLTTRWRKGEPVVDLRAFGVLPIDTVVQVGSTVTDGFDNFKAVYAGTGAASEYADLDVAGKAVLVTRSDSVSPVDRAEAAAAAGAKLLVVVNDGAGGLLEVVGESRIPVVSVHKGAGERLVRLAQSGGLRLTAKQDPYADYLYDLTRNYPGQVPDRPLSYQPSHHDLARIDARYHAVTDTEGGGLRYDTTLVPAFGLLERESYPGTRTEWVTPDQVWTEFHLQREWEDAAYLNEYAEGSRTRLDWFAPAVHPSFGEWYSVRNRRIGDRLTLNVQAWTSSGGVVDHGGSMPFGAVPANMKLYQGDTLIRENTMSASLQNVDVPSGTLPYHLVLDASRPAAEWRLSTRTHTEWDFVSGTTPTTAAEPLALLELDYHLDTDLRGDAKAGRTERITLTAGPQAGGGHDGGPVTSASLDVSYDDGATWKPVTLHKQSNGQWSGWLKLAKQPGGFVSLRASASTDSGWSIDQELIRAYGLR